MRNKKASTSNLIQSKETQANFSWQTWSQHQDGRGGHGEGGNCLYTEDHSRGGGKWGLQLPEGPKAPNKCQLQWIRKGRNQLWGEDGGPEEKPAGTAKAEEPSVLTGWPEPERRTHTQGTPAPQVRHGWVRVWAPSLDSPCHAHTTHTLAPTTFPGNGTVATPCKRTCLP